MNVLSLFLYFAGVIAQIQVVFIVMGSMILVLYGIYAIVTFGSEEYSYYDKDRIARMRKAKDDFPKGKGYLALAAVLFFISALFPTQQTMYLIAASELGETAITSDVAKELYSDINTMIDLQIENMKN